MKNEPTPMRQLTVEEYLSQAQEPKMAALIDQTLDQLQADDKATDRQRLRAFALVLRDIGASLEWDESEGGIDSPRVVPSVRVVLPPLRECLGALMGVKFEKLE